MKINISDKFKVILALLLVSAGFALFYALPTMPIAWRILAIMIALLFGILVMSQSNAGKALLSYVKSSIEEGRKVVWPTRQESLRLTLLVFVFILLLSLFMWLIDSLLFWVFNDLLLRRG